MSHKAAKRHRKATSDSIKTLCLIVLRRLRRILARKGPEVYRRFPDSKRPCHTCAFNPGTDDWVGMDKTVMTLLHALGTDAPFFCHEQMPIVNGEYQPPATIREMELCGGWSAICNDPEIPIAFAQALNEWSGKPDAPITPKKAKALLRLFVENGTALLEERGTIGYKVKP